MIGIQSVMLILLGVFVAGFLTLLIAPAYRRRAARLAIENLKRTMPLSEAEIRADKDRMRADYAVHVHELETKVESAVDTAVRQRIEINRRDAVISNLEGEMRELRTSLDEHQNARRVLEQSIMDRLPKVQQRLAAAKELLHQRDKELARLSEASELQKRALEEAQQMNSQQKEKILQQDAALKSRSARNRDAGGNTRFDGEVALRSELESLRAKSREQTSLIDRLQSQTGSSKNNDNNFTNASEVADQVARLSADLATAEAALRDAKSETASEKDGVSKLEKDLRRANADNRDRDTKIAQLEAELRTLKDSEKDQKILAESKMALMSQLNAREAQSAEQTKTIAALRAELAAANERLSRQANHFRDEVRRAGSGTHFVGGEGEEAPSVSHDRDIAQPMKDRINDPLVRAKASISGGALSASSSEEVSPPAENIVKIDLVGAPNGSANSSVHKTNDQEQVAHLTRTELNKDQGNDAQSKPPSGEDIEASEAAAEKKAPSDPAKRRLGLMERITQLEKTKAS